MSGLSVVFSVLMLSVLWWCGDIARVPDKESDKVPCYLEPTVARLGWAGLGRSLTHYSVQNEHQVSSDKRLVLTYFAALWQDAVISLGQQQTLSCLEQILCPKPEFLCRQPCSSTSSHDTASRPSPEGLTPPGPFFVLFQPACCCRHAA